MALETRRRSGRDEYVDDPAGAYWGENPYGYYDQNLAYFSTAVMEGRMINLYANEQARKRDRLSPGR